MQSTPLSSEYDAPDDYPLDDESMLFLMQEAGWKYLAKDEGFYLIDPNNALFKVPADEHGFTLLNAFKMFLYITEHPFAIRATK